MNQSKSVTSRHTESFPSVQNASGPLRFNMTNDYMFRAVLQSNNKVLRGLICSLQHCQVMSSEMLITIPLKQLAKKRDMCLLRISTN